MDRGTNGSGHLAIAQAAIYTVSSDGMLSPFY